MCSFDFSSMPFGGLKSGFGFTNTVAVNMQSMLARCQFFHRKVNDNTAGTLNQRGLSYGFSSFVNQVGYRGFYMAICICSSATALIATIGNARQFKSGRELAAWLGLVPRQNSSGNKQRLGRISKRGDKYLRKLLVHGARTVLRWSMAKKEKRTIWLEGMLNRRPTNVVLVAMANKTARVAWALLTHQEDWQPRTA
jgi:hypothetical protein